MVSFAKAFHKCMNVESLKAKFFIKGNPCHLVTLRKAGQWCSRRHSTEQRSLWWEAAHAQGSSENPPKKLCGSLRENDVPVWAPSHWQLQQEWRQRRRSRQSPWSPQGGRPGCVETVIINHCIGIIDLIINCSPEVEDEKELESSGEIAKGCVHWNGHLRRIILMNLMTMKTLMNRVKFLQ